MSASALPQRIAGEISRMIATGEIGADQHLSTQKLADRFAVSRSPVREALSLLERQGVLEQRRHRGYFARGGTALPPAAPVDAEVQPALDAPPAYYRMAEDWIRDAVPADVTEQFLRDRYGLTKGQLGQLLARAINEGWIDRKAGYGWRFLPVAKTPEAHEQIYRFRSVIEPAALLEPTFRAEPAVYAELRRVQQSIVSGLIGTWPADKLLATNVHFHEELARLSGNPLFHQALVRANRLRRLLEFRSMLDRGRLLRQCTEHLAILELVEDGRLAEASEAMRRHLSGALADKSPIQRQAAGRKTTIAFSN